MMSSMIESERKFIIEGLPNPSLWPVENRLIKISQTYMKQTRPDLVERVRTFESGGDVQIELTAKEFISPGVNKESNVTISPAELLILQECQDPSRTTIRKLRYVFDWQCVCYEVDVFQSPELNIHLLEVELDNITDNVIVPPFLIDGGRRYREVTGELAWTNHMLSLETPTIKF